MMVLLNYIKHSFALVIILLFTSVLLISCREKEKKSQTDDEQSASSSVELIEEKAEVVVSEQKSEDTLSQKENESEVVQEDEYVPISVLNLDANELKINPYSYSDYAQEKGGYTGINPNFYLIGFSKEGRVAYVYWYNDDGKGGVVSDFIIQSLATDKIIFEKALEIPDYYSYGDDFLVEAFKIYQQDLDKALNASKIEIVDWEFHTLPISSKENKINFSIKSTSSEADTFFGQVMNYTITAEKEGKGKKVIASVKNATIIDVFLCGYVLNPLEERAMLIYAEIGPAFENTRLYYKVSGCDLDYGFKK